MAKKAAEAPTTTDLRKILKNVVAQELAGLPDLLASLDAVQRLNVVCKLMGYVLPKVEAVTHKQGEPGLWADD